MSGKGDKRRPCLVSRAELDLRWELAEGKIDVETFSQELQRLLAVTDVNNVTDGVQDV